MKIIHAPKLPNFTRNEDGFTLIEMLVCIVIIGILSSIAVPMFVKQREVAKTAVPKTDLVGLSLIVGQAYFSSVNKNVSMSPEDFPDARVSRGTQWDVSNNPEGYCISAWSDNAPEKQFIWNNKEGICDALGKRGDLVS